MTRRPLAFAISVHIALVLLATGTALAILLRRTEFQTGNPYLWILGLSVAVAATWILAGRVTVEGHAVWRLWRRPDRHDLIMVAFFAVLLVLFVGGFERATGDGRNYFSHVRSIVVDHDLDFSNESATFRDSGVTAIFPVGTAVLWTPFYLLVYTCFGVLNLLGANLPHDGYWNPYQQMVGLATLTYGCAGLFIAYRLARHLTGAATALVAVVSMCCGGFLVWYLTIEATHAHGLSFFTVTAFLALWYTSRGARGTRHWAALGALAALMTMVRWQNILWVLPVMFDEVLDARRILGLSGFKRRALLRDWALCIGTYLVVVLPQLLVWKSNYGGFFTMPDLMTNSQWWFDPKPVEVLFSSNHGLLAWNPIFYLALLGIPLLVRRQRTAGLLLLLPFAAQLYVISAVEDWWGSSGFGGRRFDSTTLLFILGLAFVLQLLHRRPGIAVAAILLPLVALNVSFIADIRSGKLLNGRGVTFDAMVGTLYERVGNPFSFPANVAFAVAWGGTPAQYDRLGQQDFNNALIDVGSPEDSRFLLDGWWSREASGSDSFRWTGPAESSFAVPLVTPRYLPTGEAQVQADYTLRLDVAAFGRPDSVVQVVQVEVNGEVAGQIAVPASRSVYELFIPGHRMRRHLNHFVLRYAWHRAPADLGLGEDVRELAVQVYQIELRRH